MNTGPEEQQADGIWEKATGQIKEAVGNLTGDAALQADGLADQVTGAAQVAAGQARAAVRDAIEDGDESQKATGVWNRVVGKVKEEWGDMTGNDALEAEGQAQQAIGKAQQATGEARDNLADRV
ncbi:MAG: CsbD family protein [Bacteroidetes bacterium]|nr:CsbD family protein [Bacteroidota bacterium]